MKKFFFIAICLLVPYLNATEFYRTEKSCVIKPESIEVTFTTTALNGLHFAKSTFTCKIDPTKPITEKDIHGTMQANLGNNTHNELLMRCHTQGIYTVLFNKLTKPSDRLGLILSPGIVKRGLPQKKDDAKGDTSTTLNMQTKQ